LWSVKSLELRVWSDTIKPGSAVMAAFGEDGPGYPIARGIPYHLELLRVAQRIASS
jgi:hypothetical protein